MATETTGSTRTLLTLPGELQNRIVADLEPLDRLLLRSACRHFRAIISPLDMHDLLAAESSDAGRYRDLYACCSCLRLRHSSRFADNMKKNGKGKFGTRASASTRLCMDCWLSDASDLLEAWERISGRRQHHGQGRARAATSAV